MHPQLHLLLDDQGQSAAGVVDFRYPSAFSARHIRHSLHIPGLDGLNSRFSWLPPPVSAVHSGRRLLVICRKQDKEQLLKSLERWNVAGVLCDNGDDTFWSEAGEHGLVVTPAAASALHPDEADEPALLFEPSPLVERAVQAWEDGREGGRTSASVLDLGCGAARDIAWIVRRSSRVTWFATGVDNLFATVQRARLLRQEMHLDVQGQSHIEEIVWAQATAQGTLEALQRGPQSKTKGIPIQAPDDPTDKEVVDHVLTSFAAKHLPHSTYDLVLLIRFLPRPLLARLPLLAHDQTIIGISHFTTLAEEPDYHSPDASKRFEQSDVAALLQLWTPPWRLLEQVIHRAEDGRPILSVLLQRTSADAKST